MLEVYKLCKLSMLKSFFTFPTVIKMILLNEKGLCAHLQRQSSLLGPELTISSMGLLHRCSQRKRSPKGQCRRLSEQRKRSRTRGYWSGPKEWCWDWCFCVEFLDFHRNSFLLVFNNFDPLLILDRLILN